MRLNGKGIAKDLGRAETALRKAARKDYLPAIQALAEFYSHGAGAEPDLREAAVWYEKAAERGDVQAQFFTGRFYATGTGVAPNIRHAAKWFERAAESGHATAAFNIAIFHLNGSGVERNVKTAIKWFERASEGGISAAQVQLGRLYSAGNGVPPDQKLAGEWLSKAAVSGDPDAKTAYALFLLHQDGSVERLAQRPFPVDGSRRSRPRAGSVPARRVSNGQVRRHCRCSERRPLVHARGQRGPCRGPIHAGASVRRFEERRERCAGGGVLDGQSRTRRPCAARNSSSR